MRTVVLLAFAFSAAAVQRAQAQELIRALAFSVKVGASFSSFAVENPEENIDYENRTGPAVAVAIRIPIGFVSVQPEIAYLSKGAVARISSVVTSEQSLEIRYFEIPLLLNVPLVRGPTTPYLLAGPVLSYETGCVASADFREQNVGRDCGASPIVRLRRRNRFDYGALVGAGFRVAVGPGAIVLEARYSHGFADIDDAAEESTTRNRSAVILGGYSFGIGR